MLNIPAFQHRSRVLISHSTTALRSCFRECSCHGVHPNGTRLITLTMLQLLGPIFLIALLLVIRYGRGLHHIPGPFVASVLPFDRLRGAFKGHQFSEHQKYHRRYGDFVRVGPNHVSIASGAAISQIYSIGSKFAKVSRLPWSSEADNHRASTTLCSMLNPI